MNSIISRLEKHLDAVPEKVKAIPKAELLKKPAPDKWSKKEIMGHLIDSAIYNIIRFTQAQYLPSPYVVNGYAQDELVVINDYQHLPLSHILKMWRRLNRHLLHILSNLPEEKARLSIVRNGENKTLGWLAEDYLQHLEHHLAQIGI